MRRIMAVIVSLAILIAPNSYAANDSVQKLGRGVTNVLTAPVEIPKEIRAHWIKGSEKTFHIAVWIFCGFVKGTVMTAARAGSGGVDIATSPFKNGALLQPNYVFEDWPKRQEGVIYKNLGDR